MIRSLNLLPVVFVFLAGSVCFGQAAQPSPPVSTSPEVTIPAYPDTAQGLERLMSEMMKLAKDGDDQTLSAYAKSLVLPNPDAWFKVIFGNDLGPKYAAASEQQRSRIAGSAPANFRVLLDGKKTRIETHKFDRSCDMDATEKQYPLLVKRDSLVPLYDARFWDNSNTGSIWMYFAYVDGGFRYVGELPVEPPSLPKKRDAQQGPATAAKPLSRVRVGGNVQSANLIHQVTPVYPQEAKSAHIQGNVILHAIIGKDGHIQNVNLMEGVCLLSEPAIEAVKDWRYRPVSIDGEPVEVDTTITVVFKLGR